MKPYISKTEHSRNRSSRRKEVLVALQKKLEPPHVGCCGLRGLSDSLCVKNGRAILLLSFLLSAFALVCHAQSLPDSTLASIRFEQKLNTQVALDLPFQDEDGKEVRLGQYFGRKPVLLVLGYYECPMLCTLVLNGMVASAGDIKWNIGRDFDVVNVSINPRETPALAAAKKRAYVKLYGRSGAAQGWHFLTGDENSIQRLADEVGYRYAYDPASKQYAHPSGLVILTPEGRVSRYLFGVTFSHKELYSALKEASSHKVGSPIQQLILLCFHYNPITGKYSSTIISVLRLLGVATIVGLLWLIVALARRGSAAQAALVSNSPLGEAPAEAVNLPKPL